MRTIFPICCLTILFFSLAANAAERRCGWYSNPTPGNILLTDKDGSWWIQMQGRPDPIGISKIPAFDEKQFVETNVPSSGYGYGCACMTVVVNTQQQRIIEVISGETIPLRRCRADRLLPNPIR
ncbi:DUF4087 domain-containing protein [Aquamicrobium segne]|uniref:DUF4087 domain-containing protein n=1 Tax=Aquamicrobium segne TaxID=469547 RepID=A0ABW0H116_9HYPH